MESILEGKLLELLTGRQSLTTAVLMREAVKKKIPIISYSSHEKEILHRIIPSKSVYEKIEFALNSGHIVVLPEKAIDWHGKKRWGWWSIDPQTMETIVSWTRAYTRQSLSGP